MMYCIPIWTIVVISVFSLFMLVRFIVKAVSGGSKKER